MIVFFAELWLNFRARVPPYPCSHHGPYSRSRVKTMATIVASGRMIAGHDRGRLFHNEPLHPQQKGGWQHRICRSRLGHLLFASGPAWYGGQSRCTRPSQQGTPDTSLAPGLHLAQMAHMSVCSGMLTELLAKQAPQWPLHVPTLASPRGKGHSLKHVQDSLHEHNNQRHLFNIRSPKNFDPTLTISFTPHVSLSLYIYIYIHTSTAYVCDSCMFGVRFWVAARHSYLHMSIYKP